MFSSSKSSHRRNASHGSTPAFTSSRNDFRASATTTKRDFLSPEDALRRPRTYSASHTQSRQRAVSFSHPQNGMPMYAPAPPPPRYPTYMTRAPHISQHQAPAPVRVVRVPVPVPMPAPRGDRYRHSVHNPPVALPATGARYNGYETRPTVSCCLIDVDLGADLRRRFVAVRPGHTSDAMNHVTSTGATHTAALATPSAVRPAHRPFSCVPMSSSPVVCRLTDATQHRPKH